MRVKRANVDKFQFWLKQPFNVSNHHILDSLSHFILIQLPPFCRTVVNMTLKMTLESMYRLIRYSVLDFWPNRSEAISRNVKYFKKLLTCPQVMVVINSLVRICIAEI